LKIDLASEIASNFALKNQEIDSKQFEKDVLALMSFENQGYSENVMYHTQIHS